MLNEKKKIESLDVIEQEKLNEVFGKWNVLISLKWQYTSEIDKGFNSILLKMRLLNPLNFTKNQADFH